MTKVLGSHYYVGPNDDPDKYRLLQHVGGGGEAQLWRAGLPVAGGEEPVAVKILRPERRGELDRLSSRWREQAELLRFVRHPGVVGVREHFEGALHHLEGAAGDTGGRSLYLVMNWVDGLPLRDWLIAHRAAPYRGRLVLRHLEQAAEVLDWLHSGQATPSGRPVVHGDLSPGNIMITPEGQAVLVDFGLVRVATHRTAEAAGTPGYAAPEVWQSGEYSPASDRYSFGAIAYHALTGGPPPQQLGALRAGLAAHPLVIGTPSADLDQLMTIFSERADDRPSAAAWVRLLHRSATTTAPPTSVGPIPARTTAAVTAPRHVRSRTLGFAAVATTVVLVAGVMLGGAFTGDGAASNGEPDQGAGVAPLTTTTATTPTAQPSTATSEPSHGPTASPTRPEPAEVEVRRQSGADPIRLTRGHSVDLDSMEADWEVTDPDGEDVARSSSHRLTGRGGTTFSPVEGTPDIDECRKATEYYSRIELDAIDPGTSFCIHTSEGRFAWMTILETGTAATLDVIVWDPPVR